MIRGLLPCVAAVVLLGGTAAAAPTDDKADVQDIVLLTDKRPLLIRLHLTIDGKPFRAVHQAAGEAYFAALFKHLDGNGDGWLSEEEARRMPPPFRLPREAGTVAVNVAFNYRVVDADGDGRVSLAELTDYQRQFAGGAVQAQPFPRTAVPQGVSDALFLRLDADRDGRLSGAELAAAAAALFKSDFDRDELLTPQELVGEPTVTVNQARLVPLAPRRNAPSTPPTLFIVTTEDDRAGLAAALVAKYGYRNGKWASREALGLAPEAFERLDTDKDDALSAAELSRFADRPADAELVVCLGSASAGQERLRIVRGRGDAGTPDLTVRPSGEGTLLLTAGGTQVEFRVNDGRPEEAPGTSRRYRELFRAEAEKKGHLTRKDAQQIQFFPNLFGLLDRDGDGKLTEQELGSFLEQVQTGQAALIAATPALLVSDRGAGLFELLDRDRDGRLSQRELRGAPALLSRLGREAEGFLAREDLAPTYQVAVGLGQASFARGGPGALTPRETPMLTLDWARSDLVWFHRMDRNRDGDVSPREFLGSREKFRQLDTDGDGLISLEEAERAR